MFEAHTEAPRRFFSHAGGLQRAPVGKEVRPLDVVLLGRGNVGGALLGQLPEVEAVRLLAAAGRTTPWGGLSDALERSERAVLVDCTAADGMESLYQYAF